MSDETISENALGLDFAPILDNSSFNKVPWMYFYPGGNNWKIHINRGCLNLGFKIGEFVEYLYKCPYLLAIPHKSSGLKITNVTRTDGGSVSGATVMKRMGIKELPPTKPGKKNSGVTIIGKRYKYKGQLGLIFDMTPLNPRELYDDDDDDSTSITTNQPTNDMETVVNEIVETTNV